MSVTSAQTVDLDALSQQLSARSGYLRAEVASARWVSRTLEPGAHVRVDELLARIEFFADRLQQLASATAATSQELTAQERRLTSSMGDLSTGLVWLVCQALPFVISRGSQGAGVFGAAPALTETSVSVRETGEFVVEPPRTLEEMVQRIPHAGEPAGQIRIEKYGVEYPVYYVYLAGTADFGLMTGVEAWDMTSNVEAMATHNAGSVRAAVEAMREAGISADDQVILVGHSQGGLVAARIAESEQFHVTNLVTVGAPIHKVEVPKSTQVLALEHREDPIPMISGIAAAGTLATTLTVERSVAGIKGEPGDPLPAHNLARYVETAHEADRTSEPRLSAATREVTSPVASHKEGQVSTWKARRT